MDEIKPPVLLKKGAEANLYLGEWYGRRIVFKRRLPKEYRPLLLDERIRTYRTIHEPQLMHEAKKAGVPTPVILRVEPKEATITMQYIKGKQVKQILKESSKDSRQKLCFSIGESIGKLHERGLIHGDLTTSNFIQEQNGRVFFVDFGLGEKTKELEARGVDLHLMKRALQSTHYDIADECFAWAIEGYTSIMETETAENVLQKIREIERRGRYIAERKEKNFSKIMKGNDEK